VETNYTKRNGVVNVGYAAEETNNSARNDSWTEKKIRKAQKATVIGSGWNTGQKGSSSQKTQNSGLPKGKEKKKNKPEQANRISVKQKGKISSLGMKPRTTSQTSPRQARRKKNGV